MGTTTSSCTRERELFVEAIGFEDLVAREAFVVAACGDDGALSSRLRVSMRTSIMVRMSRSACLIA